MAFFDQLSSKLTQTSQTAVQKTKDMAEIMRLNSQISEQERKIEQNYREIGKLYYENFADKDVELFRSLVAEIRGAEGNVQEMKASLLRLKGARPCPVCGAQQPAGSVFCNACGAKIPEASADAARPQRGDGVTCRSCGAVMPKDAAFCTNCGTKLETSDV